MMVQAQVSGIECLDPPPLGNVDLRDAVRLLNGKIFIKGNVDPVNTLLRGDADKIIPPALQMKMAERAKAHITHVNGSHPSMIEHPEAPEVRNTLGGLAGDPDVFIVGTCGKARQLTS